MHRPRCRLRPRGRGRRPALLAVALAVAVVGSAPSARADEDSKDAMVVLYTMQMAPKACNWTDIIGSDKMDNLVADTEAFLRLTDEEKAKYKGVAEQTFKPTSEGCDNARLIYEQTVR